MILVGTYPGAVMPGEACLALWGLPSIEDQQGVLSTKLRRVEIEPGDGETYDIDLIPMVEIFVNTPLDNGLKS